MFEARTNRYEDECAFLLAFVDDTEESPWMVASDYHLLAEHGAVIPTRNYLLRRRPDLYVSGELLVRYPKPDGSTGQVGPDMLAAYAPQGLRSSFDVVKEGGFPAFVLEIVSPESDRRDKYDKARLYDLLGAREYAIFDPRGREGRQLWGYRRDERGAWLPWPREQWGEPWSAVLGLTLVAVGFLLRFRDEETGLLIPLLDELDADLAVAEAGRDLAEAAREQAEQRATEERAAREQEHAAHERAEAAREQAETARDQVARAAAEIRMAEAEARARALEEELARLRRQE
ncbi:MAG TPA: Uma2 family endonuclease, partial [Chloroflexota bacterium]|nr:Uma2 family endonuclease [Chloroflexota bacterium]